MTEDRGLRKEHVREEGGRECAAEFKREDRRSIENRLETED